MAIILPASVTDTISPYPTVVTVATVHQAASSIESICESGCPDSMIKMAIDSAKVKAAENGIMLNTIL